MPRLLDILIDLKACPRPLTEEEDRFLNDLTTEFAGANDDVARWRIMEREGLTAFDDFGFDRDLFQHLTRLRQGARH
jgi:hypothetical protein